MAEEWEREWELTGAELIALLRDLAQNQALITNTQQLMEEISKSWQKTEFLENRMDIAQIRWRADHTLTLHALNHPCRLSHHRLRHITERDFQPSRKYGRIGGMQILKKTSPTRITQI